MPWEGTLEDPERFLTLFPLRKWALTGHSSRTSVCELGAPSFYLGSRGTRGQREKWPTLASLVYCQNLLIRLLGGSKGTREGAGGK